MKKEGGLIGAARIGYALVQGLTGLVAAGSVLAGAHALFLRYYAREWGAVQFTGPNECSGEEMVANGDLIGGVTLCNKPENFVPWIEVYKHHPVAAAEWFGGIAVALLLIGLVWSALQRQPPEKPFGAPQPMPRPPANEHLR